MKEHKTPFPIVIQLLEGAIDFGVNEEVSKLTKGTILTLEGNIPHNLIATEDSVVRLTLSKQDGKERVEVAAGK
jgi:quercetin dioxygenase-like cupin family protein